MHSHDDQLHDLIAEQAAEWYVAASGSGLDPQQAREFMRWLRTSPVHVAEYLTLTQVANSVAEVACRDSVSMEDLLRGSEDAPVQLKTAAVPRGEKPDTPCEEAFSPRKNRRAPWRRGARERGLSPRARVRWALAYVAIAAILVAGFTVLHNAIPQAPGETFATQHGELRSLRLSDGTFVQLDSNSMVTVRFDRSYRTVIVDRGQAYFKVVNDSGRPFRVQAGRSLIRDIGTAFDVYRRASHTIVTVAHGKVQVWDTTDKPSWNLGWLSSLLPKGTRGQPVADLKAGQQVTLTASGQVAQLDNVDVQRSLAWRQGRIAFDAQPIAWVAAEFNRYNNVRIEVKDPVVGDLQITGTFSAHDVHTFAAFLASLPNVTVDHDGNTIMVASSARRP